MTSSMPVAFDEELPLRNARFWILQVAGWLLLTTLYFRDSIEYGLHGGYARLTVAITALSWGMGVVCSTGLALAYLASRDRWGTGVRTVPLVMLLALLAAVPWGAAITGAHVFALSADDTGYRYFFHGFVLMGVWSGAFLWFVHGSRLSGTQSVIAPGPDLQVVHGLHASQADASVSTKSVAESSSLREDSEEAWTSEKRLLLREGKSVKFCRVRDIAYIQAADDYTEVHLSSGQAAIVMQRLRYWESQLPEGFVRIHRSTLINLDLAEELVHSEGAWRVRLRSCPEPLTVSRRFAQGVRAAVDGRQDGIAV